MAISLTVLSMTVALAVSADPPQSNDARSDAAQPAASNRDRISSSDFSRQILATIDLVLKRHIDPPPRQAMVAEAVRALRNKANQPIVFGLGRSASRLGSDDEILRFLADAWTDAQRAASAPDAELQVGAIAGLLQSLPGQPPLISPKEAKVRAQIRGNRYVGIGIQIAMEKDSGQQIPVIINPFPGGPARVAGARPGDRILEIDGVSTDGMTLETVVDRLRGEEGTALTIVVQAKGEQGTRTLPMTRGVIPFLSFSGFERISENEWEYRTNESEPVGYLQLTGILASTLSELRRLAPQLEAKGIRGLVLDLRSASPGATSDVQHAILLADELLEEGPIGALTDSSGSVHEYQSGPDCLFRKWPIAVLVNQYTYGEPEFLAAALQDNHRAVIIGERTRGLAWVHAPVELPGSLGTVMLPSGVLSRAGGAPLHRAISVGEEAETAGPPPAKKSDESGDWGVRPDHVVPMTTEQYRTWSAWRQEQGLPEPPATGRSPRPPDPQLDKALEILRDLLK